MSENKHFSRFFAGKGYYIALILCVAAIGITGYVYYRGAAEDRQVIQAEIPEADWVAGTAAAEPDVAVIATRPAAEAPLTQEPQSTAPAGEKKFRVTAPVAGEEIFGYSMEALSYNQTTRDWRVHNGVDFAAPAGTPVVAAADGQVYTVYEDDQLGMTVVIRHEGGYTTKYASLAAGVSVSAGQNVTMGQPIGAVGTTALMENALGDHVHFCVTKNDESVDPMAFLE